MEPVEVKFIRDQLQELAKRTSAVEQYIRGKTGTACPQCEADTYYAVAIGRTAPKGWGVVGKNTTIYRCAMCGHEETRKEA